MTRQILILFFLTVLVKLSSFGQSQSSKKSTIVADNYTPVIATTVLSDKLEFVFKQFSPDTLGQVFIDWNEKVRPNAKDFIEQNDTIKAVFDAYKAFYKPLDLLKLGDWEWGNKLNSECRYVVVQNKIFYAVVASGNFDDFDWRSSHQDSISNFRPPLNIDRKKVLYLTAEYNKALNF